MNRCERFVVLLLSDKRIFMCERGNLCVAPVEMSDHKQLQNGLSENCHVVCAYEIHHLSGRDRAHY